MDAYFDLEPIDCEVKIDASNVKGKTAVITGGAGGIGEVYARTLVEAGAFVVIGDVDVAKGEALADKLGNATFVKCDVTVWNDQLEMFKTARTKSPNGGVDIVVANAGISTPDDVFSFEQDQEDPTEPKLMVTKIDHIGVLYTIKLALHYFRRQFMVDQKRESNLILQGSLAGYLDLFGAPQYNGAKFGLRGMMRSLRRTSLMHGTRVNYIGPWYIATDIMNEQSKAAIEACGTGFALVEDCGPCLLRILSDPTINGRSLSVVPRWVAASGYRDMDGDYTNKGHWLREMQGYALAPARQLFSKVSRFDSSPRKQMH